MSICVQYTRSGCKLSGDMAELVFQLRAYEAGFVVSKPFGDNAPYDFLIDNGKKIFRVQVKSTAQNVSMTRGAKYKFNSTYSGQKTPLGKAHIDVLAAYIHGVDAWYIIPADKLGGRCSFVVNPKDDTDMFARYKNGWWVLNGGRVDRPFTGIRHMKEYGNNLN